MMSKHGYVDYLMPLTKQEPDFGKYDEIFEAAGVFGLEVLTMRYIAAAKNKEIIPTPCRPTQTLI